MAERRNANRRRDAEGDLEVLPFLKNSITPRPYLSYTQLSMFERSPETYQRVYIDGARSFSNGAMDFGSMIGKFLELDELSGDPKTDMILSRIKRYEMPEHEITAVIKDDVMEVPILAKIDSAKKDLSAILEYKTGRRGWTQAGVDKNDQLTFYATAIWLVTKKIPDLELIWAETEYDEYHGTPQFTGLVRTFETKRSVQDCLLMMSRIKTAWAGISKMTAQTIL